MSLMYKNCHEIRNIVTTWTFLCFFVVAIIPFLITICLKHLFPNGTDLSPGLSSDMVVLPMTGDLENTPFLSTTEI